jgi:hypothetical protein
VSPSRLARISALVGDEVILKAMNMSQVKYVDDTMSSMFLAGDVSPFPENIMVAHPDLPISTSVDKHFIPTLV